MKKLGRNLLLILIILSLTALLASCELLEYFRKERHTCSFSESRVVSQHSCTTDGIIVKSCICGRETTELTPATGHSFGEWTLTENPGCTTYGKEERSCSVCGHNESRVLQKISHDYEITEEIIDDVLYNRFTCISCGESFHLNAGITLPPMEGQVMLPDCEKSFSFILISVEDESYILNHISVSHLDDPESTVALTLTELGDNRWLVTSEDYAPGESYIARRSEGVFLEDYGFSDVIFSIARPDGGEIGINETIIFVGKLEKESPGYYPYSVEYSHGSGEYFLSLEKADGLNVGDLICVGPAKSAEELLSGNGSETFGKINSITTLDDGRVLILLGRLTPDEIFSALDISKSDISKIETLSPKLSLEDKIYYALTQSPDFNTLLSSVYTVGSEFLQLRGLGGGYSSLEDLLESVSVTTLRESGLIEDEDGNTYATAKAEITVEIFLPATLGKEEIGGIRATLKYIVEITNLDMKVQLTSDENVNLSLDIYSDIRSGVGLDIRSDIDYIPESKLFVSELDDGIYHLAGCSEISGLTTSHALSALYEAVGKGDIIECKICKPITLLTEEMHLVTADEKVYHNVGCEKITNLDGFSFTERSYAALMADEYLPCQHCQKEESSLGRFEEAFIAFVTEEMANEKPDSEDTEEEIQEVYTPETIVIGAFATTMTGVDRQIFNLGLILDFSIEATTRYSRESLYSTASFYREGADGTVKYQHPDIVESDLGPIIECKLDILMCGYMAEVI